MNPRTVGKVIPVVQNDTTGCEVEVCRVMLFDFAVQRLKAFRLLRHEPAPLKYKSITFPFPRPRTLEFMARVRCWVSAYMSLGD